MDLFVGVTDGDWYELLASQPGLDEVNQAEDFIVGGGVFAHSSLLPTSLAWESFGIGNGATTIVEMHARIEKYRRQRPAPHEDYRIGCIILTQPFFLPRDRWIPVPASWHPNIVQGKTYAQDDVEGRRLWSAVQDALQGTRADAIAPRSIAATSPSRLSFGSRSAASSRKTSRTAVTTTRCTVVNCGCRWRWGRGRGRSTWGGIGRRGGWGR